MNIPTFLLHMYQYFIMGVPKSIACGLIEYIDDIGFPKSTKFLIYIYILRYMIPEDHNTTRHYGPILPLEYTSCSPRSIKEHSFLVLSQHTNKTNSTEISPFPDSV